MENGEVGSQRLEFEEALLREDVVEYFQSQTPEEIESKFGKNVARMIGFEQKNAHHCYDLWGHTLHTVASVDTTNLTEEQARKLKVAAFFHDIGKPDVVGFNPRTNQQNFFNHAVHSVEIAKPILEQLGYSDEEIKQLSFYIAHHDDFISYKPTLPDNQKFHAFLREINERTVAEIVVQNQYDFNKMGYPTTLPTRTTDEDLNKRNDRTNNDNKLKVRYICSALNNNGFLPIFRNYKGAAMNVDIDINDVLRKVYSGEYDSDYIPTLEDYKLLLEICKADARAQSEEVIQDGKVVDSKKRKLETMELIGAVLPQAYKTVEERDDFLKTAIGLSRRKRELEIQNEEARQLYEQYNSQRQKTPDDN